MPFNVLVRPRARRQLIEAFVTLEISRDGRGAQFDAQVRECVERLAENPFQFPEFDGEIRRALEHRFKYVILFVVRKNSVSILAVIHAHRDLTTWRDMR